MSKTRSTRPQRTRRWWFAALFGVAALVAPALASGAAMAADAPTLQNGDHVYIGDQTQGYGGTELQSVYSPIPADTDNPGDPQFWTYCIEHSGHRNSDVEATVGDFSSYLGDNDFTDPVVQNKVLWIVTHSYPALSLAAFGQAAGDPGITQDNAIEATQDAIWTFTEGVDFGYPESQVARDYLVNGANASGGSTPAEATPAVSVTPPSGVQTAGSLVGPFVLHTNQPTASVTVTPTIAVVDATGNAIDASAVTDGEQFYLDLSTSTTAGSAAVTASVSGSSATGKVLSLPTEAGQTPTAANHAQSLILVTPSTSTTSAQTSAQWDAKAVPSIGTTLVDSTDGDHELPAAGGTLTDTVAYANLTPGTEYTVAGTLMKKSDGSSTGITGSATFTPTSASGTVDVHFTVPAGYAGDALVAYESVTTSARSDAVATHEDINDASQTVTVDALTPSIGTTLVDSTDGDHVLPASGGTLTDTVAYTNLTPGTEYTVSGTLMLKPETTSTGITGSATFTPTSADGTVDVHFTVPAGYAGDALVAYESVTAAGSSDAVATHEDINDASQTVTVDALTPSIGTTLVDSTDGDHELPSGGGTLTDTVAYQNLVPGTEYTVSGRLMLKSSGASTGITGSTTFTPTSADGTVDVSFTVPAGYAGDALVAYESVTASGSSDAVATHEDINDADQTVSVDQAPVPSIGTTLVDSADGDHVLPAGGGNLTDTVAYTNLTPGTQYTVTGTLMLKPETTSTGITGSATFTPTSADGTVDVHFTVPSGYAGDALVAYESVTGPGSSNAVATHEDINDAAQTVTVDTPPLVPSIGTTLVDSTDGDHELPATGGTLTDTVAYTNLTPGTEYTVSGTLMKKSDGTSTGITGSATFTPTSADGTVDVHFTVPSGYAGDALVAYESVSASGSSDAVATHEDINDASQTVTVDNATPPTGTPTPTPTPTATSSGTPTPVSGGSGSTPSGLAQTGSDVAGPLALGGIILALGVVALVVARRRNRPVKH